VCIHILYTVCPSEPPGFLLTRMSKNRSDLELDIHMDVV
jgi:hypothetical protein